MSAPPDRIRAAIQHLQVTLATYRPPSSIPIVCHCYTNSQGERRLVLKTRDSPRVTLASAPATALSLSLLSHYGYECSYERVDSLPPMFSP